MASFLPNMSTETRDLVAAFKAITSAMKCEDLNVRKHDKSMQVAKVYMVCEEPEKVLFCVVEI